MFASTAERRLRTAPRRVLFTENESNAARLFGCQNASPYVKDAFHDYVVDGREPGRSIPRGRGTKAPRSIALDVPGRARSGTVRLRLFAEAEPGPAGPSAPRSSRRLRAREARGRRVLRGASRAV